MPTQWTFDEDLRYHFFLILNLNHFFPKPKINDLIFKQMENFIRSKRSNQCRSHHQKRVGKNQLSQVLKEFYRCYYQIRLLDIQHCKMEMFSYLTKVNPTYMSETRYEWKKMTIQAILEVFQDNCILLFATNAQNAPRKNKATQTLFTSEQSQQTQPFDSSERQQHIQKHKPPILNTILEQSIDLLMYL